jgi:hypothetical protein
MSDQMILLSIWAGRKFDPPPCQRTLQKWARDGRIYPKPIRIGRPYWVQEDAVIVKPQSIPPITVLESKDPIVNDIISGQTQNRRQA